MKYYECLPEEISYYVSTLKDVRELRIRNGRAARINVAGQWFYVGKSLLCKNYAQAAVLQDVCADIIKKACNSSVYAYENALAKGYFTLEDGCRVGVAGETVGKSGDVFRTYTSLCFRIPKFVQSVTEETLEKCYSKNVVVIGPPNSGKTTFLRHFAVLQSRTLNVLAVDERGELFYGDVAKNCDCDVLKWTNKKNAFEIGVRSLSPDLIVCDELSESDESYVKSCVNSGVNVACSVHGFSVADFAERFSLAKYFQVAVVMNKNLQYTIETL